MPIQDFNTLFAKESLAKRCAETLGPQMCFEKHGFELALSKAEGCRYEMK